MLNMSNYIKEPDSVREVEEHLLKGKLCLTKLVDGTILTYKNGDDIHALMVRTGGEVERGIGEYEHYVSILMSIGDKIGLPTLLNKYGSEAEDLLDTLVLYETSLRSN